MNCEGCFSWNCVSKIHQNRSFPNSIAILPRIDRKPNAICPSNLFTSSILVFLLKIMSARASKMSSRKKKQISKSKKKDSHPPSHPHHFPFMPHLRHKFIGNIHKIHISSGSCTVVVLLLVVSEVNLAPSNVFWQWARFQHCNARNAYAYSIRNV